ncbi:MAG: hypothetical protein D6707_01660, partial [Bacteroidetes bacterium]
MKTLKRTIPFLLTLLFMLFYIACNEKDVITPSETASQNEQMETDLFQQEQDLDILAQAMARVLNDNAVRQEVKFKVKVAETRENIVNFGSLVLNTLTPEGKTIAQV